MKRIFTLLLTLVTIGAFAQCSITITEQSPTCTLGTDGSITTVVSGGTSYSYFWNNGATTQDITGLDANTYIVTMVADGSCTVTESVTLSDPSAISITMGGTNPLMCEYSTDGAVEAFPTGGATDYTYMWSTGATTKEITGLSKDTYYVTVTDACGSTITDNIILSEQYTIIVNGTVTDVACNGGSSGEIVHIANTTRLVFDYAWNNGETTGNITGLAAGTYMVTTTYNGCDKVTTYTVTEPAMALSAVISCNATSGVGATDGSATVIANGGTTDYTFVWSAGGSTTTSTTGLSAGAITVTVTDANGCTAMDVCSVTDDPCSSVSALSITSGNTDAICNGSMNGAASVVVSGGMSDYTYMWSNNSTTTAITGIGAGTYSVVATDACGTTITESITVSEPASMSISETQTNVTCPGGNDGDLTVSIAGGVGTIDYMWSQGSNTAAITDLTEGTYSVTATDDNNCTAMASYTVTSIYMSYTDTSMFAWAYDTAYVCFGDSIMLEGMYYKDVDTVLVTGTSMNGCDSVMVTTIQSVTVTASLAISGSTICAGETVTLDVTAVGTDTYAWYTIQGSATTTLSGSTTSNTDMPSDTTQYYVVASDATSGCEATSNTVDVDVLTAPTIIVTQNYYGSPYCIDSVQATSNLDTTFLWALPGGGFMSNTSGLLVAQVANTTEAYEVSISLANGCAATESFTIAADASCGPLGVEEKVNSDMEVFISNEQLNINMPKVDGHVLTVYDITGKTLYKDRMNTNRLRMDMANYPSGVYLINVTDRNGNADTKKVVK